jgi:methyl-accepting chemotaxis protein
MTNKAEIEKAIGAHGMWKTRLKQAIDTGELDVSVATIQADNQCVFGKWLYGPTLTPADTSSVHYKKVKELHAQFHIIASKVAALALTGKKEEAEKMMRLTGEYTALSAKLTQAMMDWKKSLG